MEKMIINHNDVEYIKARKRIGKHGYNGAYYYSEEICRLMIPNIDTDRNWITIKAGEKGCDHSICFVHNNLTFEETYKYMRKYDDVIYVVGLPDMVERAEKFGKTIYLPLSVDTKYVKLFQKPKTKEVVIAGRTAYEWKKQYDLPKEVECIGLLPREILLSVIAEYKQVYAIGRTAIEGRCLGAEILPFHPRLMDVDLWQVLDTREATKILQEKLNEIDNG